MLKPLAALLIFFMVAVIASCSTYDTSLPIADAFAEHPVDDDEIRRPLTNITGDIGEGVSVFVNREEGHCVLCHQVESVDAPFQGNLGPDLSAVGSRLTPAQIRLRIVDASRLNPATVMPPYYRTSNLSQLTDDLRGKPVLTAGEVEQLVYFLSSLQGVSE